MRDAYLTVTMAALHGVMDTSTEKNLVPNNSFQLLRRKDINEETKARKKTSCSQKGQEFKNIWKA